MCRSVGRGALADCRRVGGRTHPLFQCHLCQHQSSLIAGTVMQGTKLPLTVWFLAIYLISQAKTGLSALALKRHLGVSYLNRLAHAPQIDAGDGRTRDVLCARRADPGR